MIRRFMPASGLFIGALHLCALAGMLADHFDSLWLCILLFGAFTLTSLVQYAWGLSETGPVRLYWLFILFKAALAAACAALFGGLGATFLLGAVVLDLCLAYRPLPSGLLGAAALAALLLAGPGNPETVLLQSALFVAIWFLAHAAKGERALGRTMEETISALRVSEKRLADSNRRIREFSAELEEAARIRERGRIAKGIHDSLGHALTAVAVQLSAALQVIGRDDEAAAEKVRNAREQAKHGLDSIRGTVHMLDAAGATFAERLRQAIDAAESAMQVRILPVVDAELDLSEENRQVVLSCLREGLTNGVRHGGATAFVLKLESAEGRVRFYLEDNGSGCETLSMGYGLTAMQESVEQAGGAFVAAGMPGEGFRLTVTLPEGGNGEV